MIAQAHRRSPMVNMFVFLMLQDASVALISQEMKSGRRKRWQSAEHNLSFTMALSFSAVADDTSTLRVIRVQTDDVGAYIAQLSEGKKLIKAVDGKFNLRAWQATFAGDSTGAVIVAVEYPGSFGEFATAWDKVTADSAVRSWLGGLSGLRTLVSDSLYREYEL